MKKSLKEKLRDLILDKGYVSYGEVCTFVAEEGYKQETASRRLRELMAESVPQIKSESKLSRRRTTYISGYMRTDITPPPTPSIKIVEENGARIAKLVV